MILKQFLQNNTITAIEVAQHHNTILSVFCGEQVYGLKVDTSSIPGGTQLLQTEAFSIENDILKYENIEIDTTIVEILN